MSGDYPDLGREGNLLARLVSAAQVYGRWSNAPDVPPEVRQEQDEAWKAALVLLDERHYALRERDEARAAARDYLPHVKFSYDDLNAGKRYEIAERERLPWLGPPETPLELL